MGKEMTNNDLRDKLYYEKCLRDLRGDLACDASYQLNEWIDLILAGKYEVEGVDLDKPNYGIF